MQRVVADRTVGFVRGVAQAVLIAYFFVDGRIDFVDGLFFGNFKKPSAGRFGHLLKDFPPVRMRFFRRPWMTAPAHAAHMGSAKSAAVTFFVSKENAVDQCIRTLGGL